MVIISDDLENEVVVQARKRSWRSKEFILVEFKKRRELFLSISRLNVTNLKP